MSPVVEPPAKHLAEMAEADVLTGIKANRPRRVAGGIDGCGVRHHAFGERQKRGDFHIFNSPLAMFSKS
jgi:hypothetical protein